MLFCLIYYLAEILAFCFVGFGTLDVVCGKALRLHCMDAVILIVLGI